MSFDVDTFRAHFPSLSSRIAHFDGPGGTQTPAVVAEAIARTLTSPLSNRGGSVASERNAEDCVAHFRSAYADLFGAPAEGIVYGRSATALTFDFARTLSAGWSAGDEVVISELDHDANVRPWVRVAERTGATVRRLRLDRASAQLDLSDIDEVINERTRVVALAGASNLLGTISPIEQVVARAHAVGALVYLDAVHLAAHHEIDLAALDVDFVVCSPYKFFGPHCAVLAADPELLRRLHPDKLLPSTDAVPERFELGTLPYELMAGATAAVDFIADVAPPGANRRARIISAHQMIAARELQLRERIEHSLAELGERVRVHSVAAQRTPTLFFTMPGRDTAELSAELAAGGVLAPSGSFYAHEVFGALRLGEGTSGGLRVGVAAYTSDEDVDRLIAGMREFVN